MQFEMVYKIHTNTPSDDIFFEVFALRNGIPENEWEEAREIFFSKGQPCFRASPLTKRYGWGIHCNGQGMVAVYASDSSEYKKFMEDDTIDKKTAMRSTKMTKNSTK